MSIGITDGGSNGIRDMPCLLGRHRRRETPMAKSKPFKVQEDVRWTVLARAFYKCERCKSDFNKGVSVHHRRPRMMGGSKNLDLHQPANLIALCGTGISGCHGWVESNRNKARELGYLIIKIESAEEIPFQDTNGDWWLIDNDGQKRQFDINGRFPHV